MSSLGRNDPCHCGSGRKYKQCCLEKDEARAREERAKQAEATGGEKAAEGERASSVVPAPARPRTRQPWKRGAQNTRGFHKITAPRKVGGS